jgi:HD superfamily phosphohydrolase YqeK
MADAGGILVLGAPNRVSLLSPVTFEAQINDLLEEGRVEEALSLAQVSFSQMDDVDDPELLAKVAGLLHRCIEQADECYSGMLTSNSALALRN